MSLLTDIESFIAHTDLTESAFEKQASCAGLLRRLRRGSTPRAATEDRIRRWMDDQIGLDRNRHV